MISDCGMISCTLKLTYELDEDECKNSSVILNKYNVPISQILLKDGSSFSSISSYMMLWSRLIYIIEIRCEVLENIDSVISNISLLMELTITQTFKKFKRWGFQAATLQGDRIALVLKKRHSRNYASIDIRTSTEKSYEAMSETIREFIRDISKNKLELLE